jgi:hypothetical protein
MTCRHCGRSRIAVVPRACFPKQRNKMKTATEPLRSYKTPRPTSHSSRVRGGPKRIEDRGCSPNHAQSHEFLSRNFNDLGSFRRHSKSRNRVGLDIGVTNFLARSENSLTRNRLVSPTSFFVQPLNLVQTVIYLPIIDPDCGGVRVLA